MSFYFDKIGDELDFEFIYILSLKFLLGSYIVFFKFFKNKKYVLCKFVFYIIFFREVLLLFIYAVIVRLIFIE